MIIKKITKYIFFPLLLFVSIVFLYWNFLAFTKGFCDSAKDAKEEDFSVDKGDNFGKIGLNLEKRGVISSRFLFDLYVIATGNFRKLQAGEYSFSCVLSIPEIARKFVSGDTVKLKVTIPEGFTLNQIDEELAAASSGVSLSAFRIKDFQPEFDFLMAAPERASLEGFLFPDTYFFKPGAKEREMAEVFLKSFDGKLDLDLRGEIKSQNKTIFEVIIMASLIEKEVRTFEDKKTVSGILWNRLKAGMPLQVDSTINYITGKNSARTSIQDTKIDSLYNTYKYKGLPPGPICNPGLESIKAAIFPEASDFWYYLSKPDGATVFSRTYREHLSAQEKYLK